MHAYTVPAACGHHVSELGVLLEVLRDAVGQLLVVLLDGGAGGLVQRDQRAGQELLVLVLEGEGEAVDDGAEDLEQLGDAVVPLRLVDEAVEDVADRLPVRAQLGSLRASERKKGAWCGREVARAASIADRITLRIKARWGMNFP